MISNRPPQQMRHKVVNDEKTSIAWYKRKLEGAVPAVLPQQRIIQDNRNSNYQRIETVVEQELSEAIAHIADLHDVCFSQVILSAWFVLLYRYGKSLDYTISVFPCDLGHSSPIRPDFQTQKNFEQWLKSVDREWEDALLHGWLNLDLIENDRDLEENANRQINFPNLAFCERECTEKELTGNDLILCFSPKTSETSSISLQFETALFSAQDIERQLTHLKTLLIDAATHSEKKVEELHLMNASEYQLVTHEFNDTYAVYPLTKSVTDLFEEQALVHPSRPALTFDTESLSYGELLNRVDSMASWLEPHGLQPNELVGVCLPRGLELIITQLAVQRLGAAYVPLDPDYPSERINYVLQDAQVSLYITTGDLPQPEFDTAPVHPESSSFEVILLETVWDDIITTKARKVTSHAQPEDIAYVIYTSGSTGKPKGVQNTRRNLVNQLFAVKDTPPFTADDVVIALTTVAFDVSVVELYLPLICGARVHLVSREVAIDGYLLKETLENHAITRMDATPTTWRLLLEAGWQGNPSLTGIVGGEALPRELIQQILPKLGSFWNMYGPTETTVSCTAKKVEDDQSTITIGKPLANYQIYVVDTEGMPCPINVPGEILISGEGVAKGYLNRPELTESKFITNTFSNNTIPVYRSGDVGRWLPNGEILCHGRIDSQVKMRGYRIELGEIESAIDQIEGIKHSSVVLIKDTQTDFLAAYVVTQGDSPSSSHIIDILRQSLPPYMVPGSINYIDSLPTSPSGKVDHSALPEPIRLSTPNKSLNPPVTKTEMVIAEIWSEILEVKPINRDDNFFELGGHSLQAMRFVNMVREEFEVVLPIRFLINAHLSQVANYIQPDEEPDALIVNNNQADCADVKPGYFDSEDHRLFSILHHAKNTDTGKPKGSILLCQAVGHEYQRIHRTMRFLSDELARHGYDVLRFDYAGTGDSSGNLDDVSLTIWLQNIQDAYSFLNEHSEADSVFAIGNRLGGTLLAHSGIPHKKCVLWDPIISGNTWVNDTIAITEQAMANLDRYRFKQKTRTGTELFGYQYNETQIQEFRQLSLADMAKHLPEELSILLSDSSLDNETLLKLCNLHHRSPDIVTYLDENQRWSDFSIADDMIIANQSCKKIANWFQ